MLTTIPTQKMIEEWKQIFETYHSQLLPNRKTGNELDTYFRSKYSFITLNSPEFKKVVELNVLEDEHSYKKLRGETPHINTYSVDEVLIGIDISSGEYHIECKDIKKAIPIYDDLYVYRGLDKDDLKNYFLVSEYVTLLEK